MEYTLQLKYELEKLNESPVLTVDGLIRMT